MPMLRVIAGSARRIQLETIEGAETRPTLDRVKETLFNILQPEIGGCRFLDLFSGSGGIGIEALSRGAVFAALVEKSPKAAACIRRNLERTRLSDRARLMTVSADQALTLLERDGEPFDIIFMDPPYGHDLELSMLRRLSDSVLCTADTLVIVEASLETKTEPLEEAGFVLERSKDYKTNRHLFFRKK